MPLLMREAELPQLLNAVMDDDDADDEGADGDDPDGEDGGAWPGTAGTTGDEPSPFEIHYLPPGDPAVGDGDHEAAGDPGPGSPGADNAADGEDDGQPNG